MNQKSAGANEWTLAGSGEKLTMSAETSDAIMAFFRESNAAFAETEAFKRNAASLVSYA